MSILLLVLLLVELVAIPAVGCMISLRGERIDIQ